MEEPNKNDRDRDAGDADPERDNTGVYAFKRAIKDTVSRVDPWGDENEWVAQDQLLARVMYLFIVLIRLISLLGAWYRNSSHSNEAESHSDEL